MIKKVLIGLGIALALYIAWHLMFRTIVEYLTRWELYQGGLTMQKNEWREFDLDRVAGETPAIVYGMPGKQAILKYRFDLMYPFDGSVGFYGGSDRRAQEENCSEKNNLVDCSEARETAYLFRTIDDGKSFTRQALGHGIVNRVKKLGSRYYLNVHEADTFKDHTFISDDLGEHWHKLGDFRIEALFDMNRFIFSKTKSLSISERETTYYYTKDGGKTATPLSDKLLSYFEQSKSLSYNRFHVYQEKLVFLIKDKLISVDIDTLEEQNIPLNKPPHQLFERIDIDPESGRLYIFTKDDDFKPTQERDLPQLSVWFPFEDIFVKFDKGLYENLYFKVRGNYIGGLMHYRGILTHIWTIDYGKTWEFEVLPHYFWDTADTGYGNNRIYMTAYVFGKKGVKKGTYLIMGKIK